MKKRVIFFGGVFLLFALFLFTAVYFSNKNIESLYKEKFHNNFDLLTLLINQYIEGEKNLVELKLKEIKDRVFYGIKSYKKIEDFLEKNLIQGIWFIKKDKINGKTLLKKYEKEINSFYEENLKNKSTHTLVAIDDKPYLLVNIFLDTLNVLALSEEKGGSLLEIYEALNNLFSFSEMVYFSVLDKKENPVLYTSVYESFLPLKGEGTYFIETPAGKIYHIERNLGDKRFIAGFSLEPLGNFKSRNTFIFIVLIFIFGFLEFFAFYGILKFEKLSLKKEKEVESLKEISAISSGFAHEIRNSLNTLSLLSKTLEKESEGILQGEVERMRKIMDAMKVLTKMEVKKEKINLKELLCESITYLKENLKDLAISLNINEKETVYGDRDLLFIAFNNIIKNSFEANAKNLKIWIEKKRGFKIINFMDNGEKIPEEEVKKIFEPFFSTKNEMGVGLYLTKKILEIHGGKIELHQGREKIFKVYLQEK